LPKQDGELKVTNLKQYPAESKKYQATPLKMMTLIVAMVVIAVGFYYLNGWFEDTKARLDAQNNGKVPALNIDTSNIVDTSCKTELYAEDGSGLFDILNKNKTQPEVYELVNFSVGTKKQCPNDSVLTHGSQETIDDIELNAVNIHPNYRLDEPSKKWMSLGSIFRQEQESLL
jgi:hypothetical protein